MSVDLATCSYATFHPAMGVPVVTSLGRPKFPIAYALDEQVGALKPYSLFGRNLGEGEFTARYRERLEKTGVPKLQRVFHAISRKYDGARLVLLCFESVLSDAPEFCHRRVFADWWSERTGRPVPELSMIWSRSGEIVAVCHELPAEPDPDSLHPDKTPDRMKTVTVQWVASGEAGNGIAARVGGE